MLQTRVLTICRAIHEDRPNVAARIAEQEGVSRQTASTWLSALKKEGIISSAGKGPGTNYHLTDLLSAAKTYPRAGLSEDIVWRELCAPVVQNLPENVRGIWHHGMTEMINNAIDHSASETVEVHMSKNALFTSGMVADKGEGIFLKIQRALELYDARESILELAKGKFTTDPDNHSGEGIFFSSKMFDRFSIRSGELHFIHDADEPDLLTENLNKSGTVVRMTLDNDSARTTKEIFDRFALPEEFSFAKTIVPVRLAQHEGEKLVSRSQAKRLTRRFEKFQTVMLDFAGVEEIGQGFADEVFRVFQNAHPEINMHPCRMSPAIEAMIKRVTKAL
jgi:DNA-binding transcriptional ArsR family regulator